MDPNRSKRRPTSAFLVFMQDFRETFMKENHNESFATLGQAGGEKWKCLSDSERAPYVAIAEKRKVENENKCNKKQVEVQKEDDDKW